MKKTILIIAALAGMLTLGACGRIETGNVGLRTDFNGVVSSKVEGVGIYTAITSHVDQYTIKEIPINLENMTPKTAGGLLLKELDMTLYYKVKSPQAVLDLALKRTGQAADSTHGFYYPAFHFVRSITQSEVADAVSKHDSMTIHTERDALENEVKKKVQLSLDSSDPGAFEVTRVVVRQLLTDPTIEQSIRNVVAKEKEYEAAQLNVKIAKSNAEATQQTALTLTPAYLQHEYNMVLQKFAEKGGTVILDGGTSGKILNIK